MADEIVTGQEALSQEDQDQLNADLEELGVKTESQNDTDENDENDENGDDNHEEMNAARTEEEREAIRERRRQERKDKKEQRRQREDSYRNEIASLRRQLSDMNEWKNTVEQRRVNSGVAQLDKAIQDSQDAIEVAKRAIKEATASQNGEALVDAQELYYAARRRNEQLTAAKQQISRGMQQRPQQNADPIVINHAKTWMENKPWYDPTAADQDSRIALTVDNTMAQEGWDPRTPEYWTELDNRLKKYLPHRYNVSYNELNSGNGSRKPPTGATTQTRTTAGSSSYTLSPERVRALKEAGLWDDPVKRKAMIQRYIEQDRTNKS